MKNTKLFEENIENAEKLACFLYKKYKNCIEFEDIKQICLMAYHEASIKFDLNSENKFTTFANKIAKDYVYDEVKKTIKNINNTSKEPLNDEYVISPNSFNEEFESCELRLTIQQVIHKYDYIKQNVIVDCVFNNLNQQVVAEKYKISQCTVSNYIKSFKNDLKEVINQNG